MSNFPSLTPDPQSSGYWENRYQEGSARWDMGQPAPAFVALLNATDAPQAGRMAVLGAGNGHDALLFANRGFEVMGFDFAPSAVQNATTAAQKQGLAVRFLQRDIFALEPEFSETFDYVLEHTCFCAIDPSQREAYVRVVRDLLRLGGELIGLFWARPQPGGPPFGTTPAEVQQQFSPYFEIKSLTLTPDSIESRRGEEYLARFLKRSL